MRRETPRLQLIEKKPNVDEKKESKDEPAQEQFFPDDIAVQINSRADKATAWDEKAIGGELYDEPIYSAEELQKWFYPKKSIEELTGVVTYAERYKRIENLLFSGNSELDKELDNLESISDIFPDISELIILIKKEQELFWVAYEEHCATISSGKKDEKTEQAELRGLHELTARLEIIDEIYSKKLDQICQKKFGWLIDRARSDVQMFLIKHLNTSGPDPLKAQEILQQKTHEMAKVMFIFRPEANALASAFPYQKGITFNVALMPRLAAGEANEALVQHTLVHEYIHTVSHGFDDTERETPMGLSDETLFDQPKFTGDRLFARKPGPENSLNELATEITALAISIKHYADNPPGTRTMRRGPNQEVWAYDFLIHPFKKLEEKYGAKFTKLSELMTSVMIQGGAEKLKDFFKAESDLFTDIKAICENGINLCA